MRKRERYKWALMLESFSMGQTQQAYMLYIAIYIMWYYIIIGNFYYIIFEFCW